MSPARTRKNMAAEADNAAAKFVREHFCAKECCVYVPRKRGGARCVCGAAYDQHRAGVDAAVSTTVWTIDRCIRRVPTNAFGRIRFLPADLGSSKPSKYVRLADDSDLTAVMDLFTQYWRLIDINHPPEIVISVAGGAAHFGLPDGLQKQLLDRELMKAVETTNGWLLTDGIDTGVARAIGKATRQSQSLMWQTSGTSNLRYTIQCIGIAAWSRVRDRASLINSDPEKLNNAAVTVCSTTGKGQFSLNPDHTHFLLVDDGCYNDEDLDAVAHFRAELEKRIAQPAAENGLGIPVICILIEGGARSIERVAQSVYHDVPVLICDGTGRAADLMAAACRQYDAIQKFADRSIRRWRLSEFRRMLPEMVASSLFRSYYETVGAVEKPPRGKIGKQIEKCVENILAVCDRERMVYIFNVNKNSTLDTAILLCLLECQKLERATQLQLALRWNRADVARAKIFTSAVPAFWTAENGVDDWPFFITALSNDLTEFVRLFVDYGLDLKTRLTVLELRRLYIRTMTAKTLPWYIIHLHRRKPKDHLYLSDVNDLLNRHTRRFHNSVYAKDNGRTMTSEAAKKTTFAHPFQELFLWAVLLGRRPLALYFWEQCSEPLTTAIAGTLICDAFMGHAEDWSSAAKDNLVGLKNDLENLAVDLVKKAFSGSVRTTMVLLRRKSAIWGNADNMVLAALARDKAFLSSEACQRAIWDTWKRGFTASGMEIAISTFAVVPVLLCCKFNSQLLEEPAAKEDGYDVSYDNARKDSKAGRVFVRLDGSRSPHPLATAHLANPADIERPSDIAEAPLLRDGTADASAAGPQQRRVLTRHLSWLEAEIDPEVLRKLKGMPWWKKLKTFYTAPAVKFTYYTFFYLLYLLLYGYVILFSFRPHVTTSETALQAWTYAMMCEEVHVIFTYPGDKLLDQVVGWWSYSSFSAWNRIDFFGPLFTCIAFSLRWWPTTFHLSRLFLNINFILCMFRLFKVYYVHSYLGPKVVMIKRMTWDLGMFFGVLIIILLSYTVVSQSMLHPERAYFHGIYWELIFHGVWVLFGELQDELTQVVHPDCLATNATGDRSIDTLECVVRSWPPPILLGAYCFVGSILLVNMLIAAFAYVFEEVQSQSQQLWRYYMYFMVEEYKEKSFLPAPFNILEYIIRSIRRCWFRFSELGRTKKEDRPHWTENDEDFLNAFENAARSDLLDQRQAANNGQVEKTLQQINEELRSVSSTLDSIQSAIGARRSTRRIVSDPKASRDHVRSEFPEVFQTIHQPASHADGPGRYCDQCAATLSATYQPSPPTPSLSGRPKSFLAAPTLKMATVPGVSRAEEKRGVLRTRSLKEATSSSALSKTCTAVSAEDEHPRSDSERDSVYLEDLDVSVAPAEDGVLESFRDARESFR